jgi:hypothetical protein
VAGWGINWRAKAMTYKQFLAEIRRKQLAYIASEGKKIAKANKLHYRYCAGMTALGLHPLTFNEIRNRQCELKDMRARVDQTHGDSPANRSIYEMQVPA